MIQKTGRLAFGALLLAALGAAAPLHAAGISSFKKGMADIDRQNYKQAEIDLEAAVRKNPKSARAYFLLGYARYQNGFSNGDPEGADKKEARAAIASYRKVLALDPSLKGIKKPYKLYFDLALCYEAIGVDSKAYAAFKKAVNAAPDNFMIPLYAARLRFLSQDARKAKLNLKVSLSRADEQGREQDLIKLIKTNPLFSSLAADAVLGRMLDSTGSGRGNSLHDSIRGAWAVPEIPKPALSPEERSVLIQIADGEQSVQSRRYLAASKFYLKAISLNQKFDVLGSGRLGLIQEKIGECYRRLGLAAAAAPYLRKAVKNLPFDSNAHYELALTDAVLGRSRESLSQMEWSFKTAPSSADLRRYLVLSRVDSDLAPVRDLPSYRSLFAKYSGGLEARR
ncbi:MAG: tetratricopeptide repeat protein [Elusimicrobiota bacterium]